MPKYFNNAIIGNSKILATLGKNAELIRLYYPNIDYYQLIDKFNIGIYDNNSLYFFSDAELVNEYYEGNILYTNLKVNGIEVTIRDYILPNKNIMIRKIKFMKPSNLIVYSSLNWGVNKQVSSMVVDNTLIQYSEEMYMATFADRSINKYQINNIKDSIEVSNFKMDDYIGMSAKAIVSYEDVSDITLYITLDSSLQDSLKSIEFCKSKMENELYNQTQKYWEDYINKFSDNSLLKNTNKINEREIILRTIYMYALVQNDETGATLASPDVDEAHTKCGGYGYCWPRDALFINESQKILNMDEGLNKFYQTFVKKANVGSGLFEQRYYSNGNLAPSWGMQIDETASVIIGLSRHINYLFHEKLIVDATSSLMNFVDERGLSKPCYDLWEERKGVHLYSTASIYRALKCSIEMLKMIDDIKHKSLISRIEDKTNLILNGIKKYFVKDGHLIRSLDNSQVDISILSVVTPFDIFDANDEIVLNTIDEIDRALYMPNGGYMRYQWDTYIGGNTWIIANLWMASYYIKLGNLKKAKELFDWVTNHKDALSFLPEQIDREGDKRIWVCQLSWSHAMYIIVKKELDELMAK